MTLIADEIIFEPVFNMEIKFKNHFVYKLLKRDRKHE